MKKIIARILGIEDVENAIYKAMKKQRKTDEREFARREYRLQEQYNMKVSLIHQEYGAKVRMLQDEITGWE